MHSLMSRMDRCIDEEKALVDWDSALQVLRPKAAPDVSFIHNQYNLEGRVMAPPNPSLGVENSIVRHVTAVLAGAVSCVQLVALEMLQEKA